MPSAKAWEVRRRAGLDVVELPVFDPHPVSVVLTTRAGGVSSGPYASLNLGLHVGDDPARVLENRGRAAAAVGLGLDDLVVCRQVHGRSVLEVTPAERGLGARSHDEAPAADALLTAADGVGLLILVADCVPVVIHDPVRGALACVHAGWRGTVAGVTGATVEALVAGGSKAADLLAVIGPGVAAERYQVGPEVAEAVLAAFGPSAAEVLVADPAAPGRFRLDLAGANRLALLGAGLPAGAVLDAGLRSGGVFYSDRSERPCGRFGLLARLGRGGLDAGGGEPSGRGGPLRRVEP